MDSPDHSPVVIDFILTSDKKYTIWRLNIEILNQKRGQIRMDKQEYKDENDNGECPHCLCGTTAKHF